MQRHDAVSRYVAAKLRGKGYVVQKEPRIQTEEGLRKPDIVAFKEPTALVVDAQVVGEQFDLRRAHITKRDYYSQHAGISAYVRSLWPNATIVYTTATLNMKGVWAKEAATDLTTWGLVKQDLKTVSSQVLIGGLACWRMFNNTTSVSTPRRPPREGIG